MSKTILPEAAFNQHIALLGKTGSGKTYAAKGIIEGLLTAKRQVCILDPTGAWYGLRLGADGKSRGFDVVLLGGKHADIPLAERSGAAVARLVTEQGASVVIDTSGMHVGEYTRWFTDFAGTLYTTIRDPLHLVIDEAHYFMPQGSVPNPQAAQMLHAGNRLMSGGRSKGVRGMLITQRPAKLHKDSLSCADTLIAMRVIAPQDRAAIKDWIDGAGDPKQGKAILDSLAGLSRGEGWVWYPEGDHLERVKFPKIRTYDSSATPTHGASAGPKVTEIRLDDVKAALAEAVKEAEANDPKLLQKRIAELEREVKAKPAAAVDPAVTQWAVDEAVRQARLDMRQAIAPILRDFAATADRLGSNLGSQRAAMDALATILEAPMPAAPAYTPAVSTTPRIPARSVNRPKPDPAKVNGTLNGAQQRILDALAMWTAIGVEVPSIEQVAFVARINPKGGHFSNTVGPLSSGGYIERNGNGTMHLTATGRGVANWPTTAATLDDYHDSIRSLLKSGAQVKVLDAVIFLAGHAGGHTSTQAIGDHAGIDPGGGHFNNSIGPLGTLGLIQRTKGVVHATELLFPRGLR